MEEERENPSDINRGDFNKVVESYSNIVYLDKKRKLEAEILGLPLSKHKCSERSLSSENSPLNENPRVDNFDIHIIKGKVTCVSNDDELEIVSGKDSNSYGGESDSISSTEAKIQAKDQKTHPSGMPSLSSVSWGSSSFKNGLYSLDSGLVSKSGVERVQSPYMGGDYSSPQNDFGLNSCMNFDGHLLEFGRQRDYSCLEDGNGNIETCADKELEDMFYSNGLPPNNYVLSSGRWSVKQETQTTANNLTIDKEFEQYFSTLML